MKKILFFCIGAIGDALLTTPAVKYFRENNPDFEIHYLAGYPASEILKNNPYIDKVFVFDEIKTHFPRFINAIFAGKNIKIKFLPFMIFLLILNQVIIPRIFLFISMQKKNRVLK